MPIITLSLLSSRPFINYSWQHDDYYANSIEIGQIPARLRPPGGSAAWKIGRGADVIGIVSTGGAWGCRIAVARRSEGNIFAEMMSLKVTADACCRYDCGIESC